MALFDAPSHNISGDEDDATAPPKTATPLSDPDLVGRVLDYGDDAALADASAVAKPFARAASYAQKHRLLGVVPPGLREDAARVLLPQRFGHSAVAYGGGLWVFGGRDGARYHSDVWRFDVATAAWRLVDVAGPAPRRAHTATLLGDAMVVICVEIIAVLAPSSGEEPAPPRHRTGGASMAWRLTRRFRTNAP